MNDNKIYLYSKSKKILVGTDDYVIVDKDAILGLEIQHADDIKSSYGRVDINPDTLEPYYRPNEVIINISKLTNDFIKIDKVIEENEYLYCRYVTQKKFTEVDNMRRTGSMVKYFGDDPNTDNNFHIFENKIDYDYNPADNSLVFNLEKYKNIVLEKIKNSGDAIRSHGYYYKFWNDGPEYVQPFRKSDKNDLHIMENLKNNIPAELRQLFFFKEDIETGKRLEDKWIWEGPIVSDVVLSVIIKLISGYDAGISAAIYNTVAMLQNETDLNKLRYFDIQHVKIILRELQKNIENMPIFKDTMKSFKEMLVNMNIEPPTKHKLEDGTIIEEE